MPALTDAAAELAEASYMREEIKHQYSLLGARVNAYLSSQAFLVSAYAISMGNANPHFGRVFTLVFPLLLSILGIVLSLFAKEGIDGALNTIELWRTVLDAKIEADETGVLSRRFMSVQQAQSGDARNRGKLIDDIHRQSTYFSKWVAPIFGVSWIVLMGLAVLLHFL